jgi:hypothetical protein
MLLAIALAGPICACAKGGGSDIPDAPQVITLDAPTADMAPQQQLMTLSQTSSDALEAGTSIACPAPSAGTAANNYYRVFDLASFGITRTFTVTKVSFQVEHCHSFGASPGATVAVRVGTYDGTPGDTLATANMAIVMSNASVSVPEVIEDSGPPPTTPGGTVDAPLTATIPASSKLLVEVDAPNGDGMYELYLGANTQAETGNGYILAPQCMTTTPSNISMVTGTLKPVHLLLTVTGTY